MSPSNTDHPIISPTYNVAKDDHLSQVLSRVHVRNALLSSTDAGVSLTLARLNVTSIGNAAVEELTSVGKHTAEDECVVERLALSYNRLITLPEELVSLSRLRYVNLKHNNLTVFPSVLSALPALDTLDVSHNKIAMFPLQPGYLVNLQILSFSRNKVTRLPPYLSQFQSLDILHLDKNPIVWPPRTVMEPFGRLESGKAMREWIRTVQSWIDIDISSSGSQDDLDMPGNNVWKKELTGERNTWYFPVQSRQSNDGLSPHTRNLSGNSNLSLSSISESSAPEVSASEKPSLGQSPFHVTTLQTRSPDTSSSLSYDSHLSSPVNSDDGVPSSSNHPDHAEHIRDQHHDHAEHVSARHPDLPHQQQHTRTVSYADGPRERSTTALITAKKSLPDLRYPHPSSLRTTQDMSGSEFSFANFRRDKKTVDESTRLLDKKRQDKSPGVASDLHPAKHPGPSISSERNSYFRRLSTLRAKSVLPKPLACFIETARSILFVMCQVYHAIEHYAVHAIDERLSSVLRKVLDPANVDMMQLIRSLDRFDMSDKSLPSATVCRSLVESCRDTVVAFIKALGVLAVQLKVLAACDDIRYSRWILLELYAATAEISCAWQVMVPHITSIRPLLHIKNGNHPVVTGNGTSTPSILDTPQVSSTPLQLPRMRHTEGLALGVGSTVGKARTARRHAGSFSSKDVEIGKQLPSYEPMPNLVGNVAFTNALRTPKRQLSQTSATAPSLPFSSQFETILSTMRPPKVATPTINSSPHRYHTRHPSQSSFQGQSSSPPPSIPSKPPYLDPPSHSKLQVDKEALFAVAEAIEVAPAVWDMMVEVLSDAIAQDKDVRETLERAREVTGRLSESFRSLSENDHSSDRKGLMEDAHLFLKVVVQLSTIVKTYGAKHEVPSALRSSMGRLTNATEEFAILLHVSSFSPSIPRPHSPKHSFQKRALPGSNDDTRLLPNFTRSRSFQAPSKQPPISPIDGPRSALVTQSFKVPPVRPVQTGRETGLSNLESR